MSLSLAESTKLLEQKGLSESFWNKKLLLLESFLPCIARLTRHKVLDWLCQCEFSTTMVLIRATNPFSKSRAKSYQDVIAAVASGKSIQILQFQKHLSSNYCLVPYLKALQAEIGLPIKAITLFLTPERQQSLPAHIDDVDVVTLQLSGSKCWEIWEPIESGDISEHCLVVKPDRVTVQESGLLYLPRNVPHRVISGDGTSVSIGLIFRRPTLSDLVNRVFASDDLTEVLSQELSSTSDVEGSIQLWRTLIDRLQSLPDKTVPSVLEHLAHHPESLSKEGQSSLLQGGAVTGPVRLATKRVRHFNVEGF